MEKRILNTILVLLLIQVGRAQNPVAEFSGSVLSGCAPLNVSFKDLSTGDPKYWDWEFTDGGSFNQLSNQQNPRVNFSQPGTYSVTLVVRNQNGVNGVTKTGYIVVYPSPTVNFSANATTVCLPGSVQFTGTASTTVGTISEWLWDFGDGTTSTQQNPTHTYTETGYYNVALTVTSSNGCSRRVSKARYIRMVSGIVADFKDALPSTCKPPFSVAFTNESSGPGAMSYTWDFGNGSTDNTVNPAANFVADGDYSVQLIAQSNFGCRDTITKAIHVATYAAGFSSPDSVCLVDAVNFVNTSTVGAKSLLWDFGDGTKSGETNPVKTFTAPGSYTVKLFGNYEHCTDSVAKVIKITSKAPVDFTATNNIGCEAPLVVQFQNNTAGAISWFWDFGDGQTSTDQNPQHTYLNTGSYDVKLTVATANGCGNTIIKSRFVRVVPTTVKIVPDITKGCINLTVHPKAEIRSVDAIASYLWDFGDGGPASNSAAPAYTYSSGGVFPMQVTITTLDGCVVSNTRSIEVGTPPSAPDFSVDNSIGDCVSDTVKFFVTTTGGANEWLWDFGDGQTSVEKNPLHIYRDTGNLSVKLTPFFNGCPGVPTIKPNILHKKAPVANFGFSVDCANPLFVSFTDSSIIDPGFNPIEYKWNFDDGTTFDGQNPPNRTFPKSGRYNVSLTVTNGPCIAQYIRVIDLFAPNADFTLPSVGFCKNTKLDFSSTEDTSRINTYTWMVDGIPVRNEPAFDTIFKTSGDRLLELKVTDYNGCSATESKTVKVNTLVAQFSPDAMINCGMGAVNFKDETVTSGKPVTEWLWNFGDGASQVFSAPPFTHQYADTGSYSVKLTVKDADGCVDAYALFDKIKVSDLNAFFGADKTLFCPGLPLSFSDSSKGKGLTYLWDFGDGDTALVQNPAHIFNEGKYSVSLTVRDSEGCTDTYSRPDYIDIRAPKAVFEAKDTSSACQLLEAKFFNKSENYESFYWDFGDSTNSTLQEPKHFYDVYGNYVVKLFVKGYGGCLDSAVGQVNVYNPSVYTNIDYGAMPDSACNELSVDYTITTPPGTWFQFNYGDGKIDSSGQTTLTHLYDYPNSYRPSVTLVDAQDCRVSVSGTKIVKIKGAVPAFNIDKKQFCDSGSVFLTNFTIGNDSIVQYAWNFGDLQTTSVKNPPLHTYPSAGLYPVSLEVTTLAGCIKTFSDTVRVYRTPTAAISMDDIACIGRPFSINGSLIQPDTAIIWNWKFGDGRTGSEKNNILSYTNPGDYDITLITSNTFGCSDVSSKPLTVAPLPSISTKNVVIPVGGQIVLPVSYSSGISLYNWTPPDGLSCSHCAIPLAKPKLTTTYTIQVTDSNTCSNSAEIQVEVVCRTENYFVPNTFSPNGDGMNDVFFPRGVGLASIQSMKIFNRWGQLLFDRRNFSANDPAMGWNGKVGGKSVPPDVYVYIIEFVCENSQIIPMTGNITLIR